MSNQSTSEIGGERGGHTPGPYSMQSGACNQVHVIFGADVKYIGKSDSFPVRSLEESEANGRLFTAAPDLLEACQRVLKEVRALGDECPELDSLASVEAALTKATQST